MSSDPPDEKAPARVGREELIESPPDLKPTVSDEGDLHKKIINRTSKTILELLFHTLILGLALGSIWLIHWLLKALLGHDAKFFDLIPVRWIIDLADIVVIGKFLWEVIKEFREKE